MEMVEMINQLEGLFEKWGYGIVFLVSAVESSPFGWLTPGGHVLATAGFFAYSGELTLLKVIVVGIAGTWTTLCLGYALGRKSGSELARRLGQEKRVTRVKGVLKRKGWIVMTASLTSNVTRFWISYVAGMQEFKVSRFMFYSGLASATWVMIWSVVGFLAGGERGNLEKLLPRLGVFAWGLFLLAVLTVFWATKREYEEYEDISN